MPKTRASWGSNSPAARKGHRTLRYWADLHDGRGYRRCCKTIKGTKRDGDAELARLRIMHDAEFWSSVVLTGNPTINLFDMQLASFWSSVVLTGNPTRCKDAP